MSEIYVEKLLSGLKRLNRRPWYMKPHRARGLRSSTGETEWDEPESVHGHGAHRPIKGVVDIRKPDAGYTSDLLDIDAKRADLRKQLAALDAEERGILALAWSTGRPVTVAELKAAQEQDAPTGK